MEKRLIVYLDSGSKFEHLLAVEDDGDYTEQIVDLAKILEEPDKFEGVLLLSGKTYAACHPRHIVAVQFFDSPPMERKIGMGFKLPRGK